VICPGCDFILDTDFLGEEILDEEQQLRPGVGGVDPAVFNLADAVILGDIDEIAAQAFETSDSGFHVRESTGARLYVSGRSQVVMAPDAVPAIIEGGADNVRLTPFEKHVLTFIDGKRPVEVIRLKAGLDESEVKTALATLADKGVVEVVGRAFADLEGAEETAPRRRERRRARGAAAGAVAAAVVGASDATDRAIEEAFRTHTGLNPLGSESIEMSADDGGGVFSSLSETPLSSLEGPEAAEPSSRALPPNTAKVEGPELDDDDLPSDADNFDVGIAHTSELQVQEEVERIRASAKKGASEPEATNARRALSDPELRELLGEESEIDSAIHGAATGQIEPRFPSDSDGFDDFGAPSALDTAMVQRSESSIPRAARDDSDVFRSGTSSSRLSKVARPDPQALANLGREDEDSSSMEDTSTARALERQPAEPADDASLSLSQLLDDDDEQPSLDSLTDTPAIAPSPSMETEGRGTLPSDFDSLVPEDAPPNSAPAPALDAGADLADLVGDEDELQALLEDSDEGDAEAEEPLHLKEDDESVPSEAVVFVSDDEEESEEEESLLPSEEEAEVRQPRLGVHIPARDAALSHEGTAAFVENPLADLLDDSDEVSITTGPVIRDSSDRSEIVRFDSELPQDAPAANVTRGPFSPSEVMDEADSFHDASTGDVAALSESDLAPAAARRLAAQPDAVTGDTPAPSIPRRPVSGSEELIPEDMIIKPARSSVELRGNSVIDQLRRKGPAPASEGPSVDYEEVIIDDEGEEWSVEESAEASTYHSDESAAVPVAPARPQDGGEETFVLSGMDDVVSDLSMGSASSEAWASAEGGTSEVESLSSAPAPEPSGEATNVITGGRRAAPGSGAESTRHDAAAMRGKARKLFDDALADFRDGRVGAARMNAKLATIYDPANEEYRTALEQWGRDDGRHRQPSQPKYAILYDEAQELEGAGSIDAAIELLERGTDLYPDIAAIRNRLGVLLAIHKRQFDRAADQIQRAIELDPNNLHYKSNLGKILSKKRSRQRRANG
jgi:hypothetical protein